MFILFKNHMPLQPLSTLPTIGSPEPEPDLCLQAEENHGFLPPNLQNRRQMITGLV
jgi:hypothetical protein